MKRLAALWPLLLLAGCGGAAEEDAAPAEPTALVRTAPAQQGAASAEAILYGVTEAGPGGERALAAPAEAVIASIAAPNGTAVRAGQTVLLLRASPATRAETARAAGEATVAEAAYKRALRLRADGLVSDADVETARAAARTARAASANLGMAGGTLALRAPVAGTVQALTARPGDQIAAGATVTVIAARGDVRARFGVDPALAGRIRPGQTLRVATIGGAAPASVPVTGVDSQADPATRLASVYARIPASLHLDAGEALRATLALGASAQGITIPYAALLDDGGRSYVFVVRNGIARARDVTPGNSSGERIQILHGLQPGERVVTEGGTALEDGMKVREDKAKAAT